MSESRSQRPERATSVNSGPTMTRPLLSSYRGRVGARSAGRKASRPVSGLLRSTCSRLSLDQLDQPDQPDLLDLLDLLDQLDPELSELEGTQKNTMSYTNPEALALAQMLQPAFVGADGRPMRLDADPLASATLFLERQLTEIRSKVVEVEYAPLKALKYLPKASDISISASKYVWFSYNKTGIAEIIAPGRKSLPRVDVHGSEHTGSVVSLGAAYGWSVTDLREAARLRVDLPTKKANAARTAVARGIEQLLSTGKDLESGQTASALGGFLNYPEIGDTLTMHNWFLADGSTTPEMMVDDLTRLTWQPVHDTLELYAPNKMILASKLYEKANSTKMSSASSVTVLEYFLKNNPFIKSIDFWYKLDGGQLYPLIDAGNAGAPIADSGTGVAANQAQHRAIVYADSPEILEAVVPIEFEQFPAQMEGLEYEIACHARCGGVKVYQPKACQYGNFSAKTAV